MIKDSSTSIVNSNVSKLRTSERISKFAADRCTKILSVSLCPKTAIYFCAIWYYKKYLIIY